MLRVELATTPAMHAQGLMYRTKLAEDEGMAFIFNKDDNLRFWGVNTFIPLDIAFVNRDNRIERIAQIKPMSSDMVSSDKPCCIAIEANLGYFDSRGIKTGDKVNINKEKGVIEFDRASGDLITRLAQSVLDFSGDDPQVIDWKKDIDWGDDDEEDDYGQQEGYQQQEWQEEPDEDDGEKLIEYGKDYDFPLADEFEDEFDMSPEFDGELEQPPEYPSPEGYPTAEDFGSAYAALSWAENNNETMHIWYQTKNGASIERNIEPHGQFHAGTTGNDIVVTFDDTIGDIRAFIIPQIMNYSFTGNQFEPKFLVS